MLEAAYEAAPPRTLHCVRGYRGNATNLRTQLQRILGRAGVVPWTKTFVNLRASCRTDLQEVFPDHAINTWLGHSSKVAEKHYLQTTEGHWERALVVGSAPKGIGGVAGGVISANPLASDVLLNEKIPGNMATDVAKFPGISIQIPLQGLEPWTW